MPNPDASDLERRIREAIRRIADESDQIYDVKLSESQRTERIRNAEKAFLDGGIEISGELKSALLSASVKVRIGNDTSVSRILIISIALLIGLGLVIGGVYLTLRAPSGARP